MIKALRVLTSGPPEREEVGCEGRRGWVRCVRSVEVVVPDEVVLNVSAESRLVSSAGAGVDEGGRNGSSVKNALPVVPWWKDSVTVEDCVAGC